MRLNGHVYVVNDYLVRPDPLEDGRLQVRVLGYNEERDESVEAELVYPPDPDDPTQPLWGAGPSEGAETVSQDPARAHAHAWPH